MRRTRAAAWGAATTAALWAGAAAAQTVDGLPIIGVPQPGGTGFQPAATEIARDLQWLDGFVHIIMAAIVLLVVGLIATVILRYNRHANPHPATFTHNSVVEVAWTVGPILILVFIGAFSLPVLFKQQIIPEADITVKVTGYQWYWGYEYVDEGIEFEQFMLTRDENAAAGFDEALFKLTTNDPIVLPVGATVVMQVTAADVIHSWTIPAFGVKQDAVPGRLAELWFTPEVEGWYFGQCSELCGIQHAYMPIAVKVVSPEAYEDWLVLNGGTSVQTAELSD